MEAANHRVGSLPSPPPDLGHLKSLRVYQHHYSVDQGSGTEAQEDILEGPDGSPLLEVFAHDLEHFCAWQQQNERLGRDLLDAWPDHELGRFRGLQGVAGGTERKNPVIEYHYQRAVDIEVVKNAVYATETT